MGRLFGTDGVRGVYGSDLTDELCRALGHGAAQVLGGDFIIGRDTRASGPAIERALASGIEAAGGHALSAGIMPTAGVAHLVVETGAKAGVVISASHNPARDNGIKFFGADGMKLADAIEDQIEAAMDGANDPDAKPEEMLDADDRYIRFLLDGVPSLSGLRIIVDCANGAASNIAPEVYRDAGADVTALFCDPDGTNINDHCGSTHPEILQRAVIEKGAHLGIAHDGDADRMLAVDAHGAIVDGDQVLGICALDALARGALPGPGVVTTVMANVGFRRAMADGGIRLVETKVGDRYVLAGLRENDLTLGGEQSGHILFLDKHTTGDGILTALELLSVLVRSGRSLEDLAGQIPRFPQILENVAVGDKGALDGAQAVWDEVAAVEAELGDAGRVLVRPSGTEPVVRVMAEAESEDVARGAVDRIARVVSAALA